MGFTFHVEKFGEGKLVWLDTPKLRCGFATLGAAINSVKVRDEKKNKWIEVNCAYNSPTEAFQDGDYMGPTVGRYAGRINNGTFTLDGQKYEVSRNMNNQHTIHGGAGAMHKRHWSFVPIETANSVGVRFSLVLPHMDLGFPAELHCFVYYYIEVNKPNVLHTEFSASIPETSAGDATVVNMFNHAYWNLNGVPENTPTNPCWTQPEKVHNIVLKMPCSKVAETDSAAIPTGQLKSVKSTCLDFRRGKPLGEDIDNKGQLLRNPCGYDHPLCVDGWSEKNRSQLLFNAEAYSPKSKIQMKVYSTFPSVWLYTANNKPEKVSGAPGQRYERYTSVCLEPQHLPDSPNHSEFPSTIIRKGKPYWEKMINEFNVLNDSHM